MDAIIINISSQSSSFLTLQTEMNKMSEGIFNYTNSYTTLVLACLLNYINMFY